MDERPVPGSVATIPKPQYEFLRDMCCGQSENTCTQRYRSCRSAKFHIDWYWKGPEKPSKNKPVCTSAYFLIAWRIQRFHALYNGYCSNRLSTTKEDRMFSSARNEQYNVIPIWAVIERQAKDTGLYHSVNHLDPIQHYGSWNEDPSKASLEYAQNDM